MALSKAQRDQLTVALCNKDIASAIADAVDAGANPQASTLAAVGALTGVPADAAHSAAKTDLDTVQAKLDALIAALKAAKIMA